MRTVAESGLPAGLSDGDLLRGSATDAEFFGEFYDRHAPSLFRYFFRRTASAQTAADLTAETFAEAFEHRTSFSDNGGSARAWLFGIAKHEFARLCRRGRVRERARRRMGLPRLEVDDEFTERVEFLADSAGLRAYVKMAMESLTSTVADAVRLRVLAEMPYAEVARRLGCSEGAARVRVARGLARLAKEVGEFNDRAD